MNGVNLDQFAFEFDLTWMSFFQNAAGETYARYGGRDDAGPETYLNQESLVATMRSVLKLHAKEAVQKGGRYEPIATSVKTPASIPTMRAMIEKRDESCIHCHDVKVAQLRHKHQAGTLQKEMVFTYPDPRQLGLAIDPRETESSPEGRSGLGRGQCWVVTGRQVGRIGRSPTAHLRRPDSRARIGTSRRHAINRLREKRTVENESAGIVQRMENQP